MEIVFEPYKSLPLTDFHDELRFEFPDLPTQLFDYHLVGAAITMAKAGNLIRRRAVLQAQPGVTRYQLLSPDGLALCAVLGIKRVPDCVCSLRHVMRSFDPPEGSCVCGREIAWYDDIEKVLHIIPPHCYGKYYVTMSVSPQRGACALPEKFLTDYLDTLLMGVKSKLLLISNRPWTNLQLGNAYANEFQRMIATNAIDNATQHQRGSVKMQFGRVL